MKRKSLFKGIVLSTIVSAVLTGCGSAKSVIDEKEDFVEETKQLSISGKAIDGYLKDAVVCLDLNKDGYCQASSEPLTTTLNDGSFTLSISEKHRADENFAVALLLVFGGIDVDTGKDFIGKLYAPNDGSKLINISPITTLVAKNLEKELKSEGKLTKDQIKDKIKEAREKVADALDIDKDKLGLDPVEFKKINQDDKLIRKALQIQKSIEALIFAAGVNDSERKDIIEEIYAVLAESLEDLDAEKGLDKLFEKVIENEKFKAIFKNHDHDSMLALTVAIKENIDAAFDSFKQDENQLKKVAAITEDAFTQIKKDVKDKKDDFISDFIFLKKDDDRLKDNFDWLKKYIEQDLKDLDIEPTNDLVDKLKDILKDDVRAGVVFEKAHLLNDSSDLELQSVYKKVIELKKQTELDKDAENARFDTVINIDLKSLLSGKTFYEVEKTVDSTYKINTIMINRDATVATINDKESQLVIKDNTIFITSEDEKFILIYKSENEKYLELYRHNRETLKLFNDINDAKDYIQKE